MAVRVVARDFMKPECKEEAFKLLKEMVETTRKEKGNISYDYCQSINDPNSFAMIECWETLEDLQAHSQSEHFTRLIPQLAAMMSAPSQIEVYQEVV